MLRSRIAKLCNKKFKGQICRHAGPDIGFGDTQGTGVKQLCSLISSYFDLMICQDQSDMLVFVYVSLNVLAQVS